MFAILYTDFPCKRLTERDCYHNVLKTFLLFASMWQVAKVFMSRILELDLSLTNEKVSTPNSVFVLATKNNPNIFFFIGSCP